MSAPLRDLTPEERAALYALPKHGSEFEISGAAARDEAVVDLFNEPGAYDRRILLVTLKSALNAAAPALPAGLPDVEKEYGALGGMTAVTDAAERVMQWADHHEPWNPSGDFKRLRLALDAFEEARWNDIDAAAALEGSATLPSDRPDVYDDDFRDRHERAMRDHIIGGMDVEHECDDLCSDAILDRLAGRTPSNEYPLRATLPSDRGRTE